jgi:hypothetical protein
MPYAIILKLKSVYGTFAESFPSLSTKINKQNDYWIFGEPYLKYVQGKFISTFFVVCKLGNRFSCLPS